MGPGTLRGWGWRTGLALCLAVPAAADTAATRLTLGYAGVRDAEGGTFHGLALSVTPPVSSRLGLALELDVHDGGYEALCFLMAGPRLTGARRGAVRPFGHVLAGAAFTGSDSVFVVYPGAGIDIGAGDRRALRLQLDWPLITPFGVFYGMPRTSLAMVWRVGGGRGDSP